MILFLRKGIENKRNKKKHFKKCHKRPNTKRDSAQRDHKILANSWPRKQEGCLEHATTLKGF